MLQEIDGKAPSRKRRYGMSAWQPTTYTLGMAGRCMLPGSALCAPCFPALAAMCSRGLTEPVLQPCMWPQVSLTHLWLQSVYGCRWVLQCVGIGRGKPLQEVQPYQYIQARFIQK